MAKKKRRDVLIGMRVAPERVRQVDAIVEEYSRKHPGAPWSRSDALREILILGMAIVKDRVGSEPEPVT